MIVGITQRAPWSPGALASNPLDLTLNTRASTFRRVLQPGGIR